MSTTTYRSLIGLALFCLACAAPRAQLPQVTSEAVAAEQAVQRRLVIEELDSAQRRLADIGFPMLVAATPLCGERTTTRVGARMGTVSSFTDDYVEALSTRFSLTDTLAGSRWLGSRQRIV